VLTTLLVAAGFIAGGDTLRVRHLDSPPDFDGASWTAYGAPAITIPTAQGGARIWAIRVADTVYITARISDSTYYWGDDLVISLDPLGDRTPAPGHDDTQWYLRRLTDSSVVNQGRHGRWMPPGDDPDWHLGASRGAGGWELASSSDAAGWSVELRLPVEWLADSTGRRAAIAFRTYDNSPSAWYAWPVPLPGEQPTRVEMLPARWATVVLEE
jgi:hypothetical protein